MGNLLRYHIYSSDQFDNAEDILALKKSLNNVTTLHYRGWRMSSSADDVIIRKMNSILGNNLSKLCLKNYWQNLQSVLDIFENFKSTLKEFNFFWCKPDDNFIDSLSEIEGLNLTSVRLIACEDMTDARLKKLVESQKNIRELEFTCCYKLTDDAIIMIYENLPSLQSLRIFKCLRITNVSYCTQVLNFDLLII